MNDFLYRLADRSLGIAPVVTPLVGSIFGPGRDVSSTADTAVNQIESQESLDHAELISRDDSETTSAPSTPPIISANESSREPKLQREPLDSHSPSSVVERVTADFDRSPERVTPMSAAMVAAAPLKKREPEEVADRREAEPNSPSTERPRFTGRTPSPGKSEESMSFSDSIPPLSVEAHVKIAERVDGSPAILVSPRLAGNTPVSERYAVDQRPFRPTSSLPDRSVASEPTIQVTIGRIEVRAEHPTLARAEQRTTAPGPRLSLDDYLRRQNGGSR